MQSRNERKIKKKSFRQNRSQQKRQLIPHRVYGSIKVCMTHFYYQPRFDEEFLFDRGILYRSFIDEVEKRLLYGGYNTPLE